LTRTRRNILLGLGTLAVTILAVGALVVVALMERNQDRIDERQTRRLLSYQLADEVRQSSDDLTRMARTYVVTREPRFEEYFNRILEIRDGRAPRPVGYHGIYWDFVIATGRRPRPDGDPIALESRMRESGFTSAEFALLDRAKDLSDDLVALEERAMHAVKGLFPDATGAFSIRGEPDPALARDLLHGPEYHEAKAAIMSPIDEFVGRVDARTADEIADLRRHGRRLGLVVRVILGVGIVLLALSPLLLRRIGPAVPRTAPAGGEGAGAGRAVSARSAWPLLTGASVVVLGIVLVAWWNQARIEDQMRSDTGNALATVLEATTGSVQQWFLEREQEARVWARHIEVREHARTLAEGRTGIETATKARAGLQAQLDEFALGMGYDGYLVLSRDGTVVASQDPATLAPGTRHVVREEFLANVVTAPRFAAIGLPQLLSVEREGHSDPVILIGAAIREDDGGVLAALVLIADPQRTFTQILQRGRIGESGESYAFDRSGRLISESRFDDQLREIGLISEAERALLRIQIRDPGGDLTQGFRPTTARSEQPLTHMAEQAIANGPGANLEGYNDYRGVPVVGAWTWDEINGIGIATEMDVAEAYRSVRQLRLSAFSACVASVVLVLSLSGLFLRHRNQMAEAQSELASVLQRFRSVTESANDAVISSDATSTVVGWNRSASEMFGWSDEEIRGRPLETIIPERFREAHVAGLGRFTKTGDRRLIGRTIEISGLHREGHEFPIEMSLSTWKVGDEIFYTGIIRDITERKRMEQELEKARRRMEDELNVGREIQMSMLPLTFPPFIDRNEFTIYATLIPAREVGGDFYDFFFIDDEHLCMCVGDVSGKGVPSALFMAVTRTLIKSAAADDPSPASILTRANTELSERNESCMFVTLFVGILDVKTGRVRYTNAGHNPPYLKRADGSVAAVDERHGPVIGGMPGLTYAEDELVLAPDDLLVMYTDGVTEAMSPTEDLYTEERLARLIRDRELATVEDAVRVVLGDIDVHAGGAEQSDDITVLAVRFQGRDVDVADSFDLTVPNRLPSIDTVNERFNGFASDVGLPDEIRRRVNMVFDELLNNIISYAFDDAAEHGIEVRVRLEQRRLVIEILDDGRPFNPFSQETPDTTLPLESRRIGGLGIHLVQNVMDDVSYERRIDKNLVKLVKKVAPS
jgi:sigma-B regulation protein RsbU (phosphoserine phosphatase)